MIVLGWGPIFLGKQPVESIIDFQNPKMLEIFFNAIDRKNLFNEFSPPTTLVRRLILPTYRSFE